MSANIIRAKVRPGGRAISRSDYGIISENIICAEVRPGGHAISRND